MNTNHVRPMVAFCALAVAAAIVTTVGPRGGAGQVAATGSPTPSTSSGSPGAGGQVSASPSPSSAIPDVTIWSSLRALRYLESLAAGAGQPARSEVAGPTTTAPRPAAPTRAGDGNGSAPAG